MAPMSVILMHGEAQEEATDFCNEAFLVPKPHKNLDPKLVFDYIKSLVDSISSLYNGQEIPDT